MDRARCRDNQLANQRALLMDSLQLVVGPGESSENWSLAPVGVRPDLTCQEVSKNASES